MLLNPLILSVALYSNIPCVHRDDVLRRVRGAGSRSLRGVGGLQETGAQVQGQLLQRIPDKTRGGRQVEEAPVEEEQDEDLCCALDLAHHRRSGTLFHPSVGGGRCHHFICIPT